MFLAVNKISSSSLLCSKVIDEKYRQSVRSAVCCFAINIPLFFHNCIHFRSRSRPVFYGSGPAPAPSNRFGGSGSGSGSDQNVSAPAAPAPAPHPWFPGNKVLWLHLSNELGRFKQRSAVQLCGEHVL